MALSNSGTTGTYGTHDINASAFTSVEFGIRHATSGGIVTGPTIVDPTATAFPLAEIPILSILGFTSSQLVAP